MANPTSCVELRKSLAHVEMLEKFVNDMMRTGVGQWPGVIDKLTEARTEIERLINENNC